MPITIRCPKCRLKYQVREENLGARTKCKICGETFTIEMTADETAGFRPSRDASRTPLTADCSDSPKGQPGQETPPDPSLADAHAMPEKIGPYTLRRPLGGGAMGEVWLAWDPALQRDVAIKTLRRELALSPQGLDRFLREARLAAKLHHTNAVTVYQVGVEGQLPYIAMEYVEGRSLDKAVAPGRPLEWREATRAIRDATAGLAAAHKLGLIHRDVKPANLIRTPDGVTKVVDFGLARAQAAQTQLTQQGSILGTPAYMAPEVWRRNESDARSDLYALACTYYCLLTGEPPFDADNPVALGYQHTHEPLPDPRQRVPGLPNAVCCILAKGASKNPEDRYQTAAEMLEEVEALLAASPQSLMSGLCMEADELPLLEDLDLLGPGAGTLASAVENAAPPAPARTRSSPDQLRRVRRFAHQPKTLRQSLEGVGQPILIGVGGGLLLVVVMILLFLFSRSPTPTEVTSARPASEVGPVARPSQTTGPPAVDAVPQDASAAGRTEPSQVQPPTDEPAPQPQPTSTEEPAPAVQPKPGTESESGQPEPMPPQPAEPPPAGPSPDMSRPNDTQAAPQPQVGTPGAFPGQMPTTEPAPGSKVGPSPKPPESAPPPEGAKPAVAPEPTPPAPAVPQKPPGELFAELTEFAIDVKVDRDVAKLPKELSVPLTAFAQAIRTKLQASERIIDLRVVERSDRGTMEVVVTPSMDPPYIVLNLKAELKYLTSEGSTIVVWDANSRDSIKSELFRFIAPRSDSGSTAMNPNSPSTPAISNPLSSSAISKIFEEKVLDFFKPLGKDHREAKRALGK